MILLFDTETTGLTLHPDAELRKTPRCIEFGGVLMNRKTGAVEEEISILINPGVPLEPIITKITGLTDADLADAPSFEQVLPQLRRIFGAARCTVCHNAPFDKAIIRGELARIQCLDFPWPAQTLCTVGLYKDAWGRNPKLTELYAHVMGRPLAQTHRALSDVMAMVEIFQKEKLWQLIA